MLFPSKRSLKILIFTHFSCLSVFLSLSILCCSSCIKISHSDGSTTYLGAVNIKEGDAGDAPFIHSRRIGIMMDAGLQNNSFALGYEDRLLVKPPADKLTVIDYASAANTVKYQSR